MCGLMKVKIFSFIFLFISLFCTSKVFAKGEILIITANRHETDALKEDKTFFNFVPNQRSSNPNDVLFYNVGKFGNYKVVHFELPDQGSAKSDGSLASTQAAIDEWNPSAVILVGVAFGKNSERQHIGDVLVSEEIADYESGKARGGRFHSTGPIPEVGRELKNVFKNYEKSWKHEIDGRIAACEFGIILSGDKVVDDEKFKEELFTRYPAAIGGEMEGRGVYAACRIKGVKEWIVVKGICDWGQNKGCSSKEQDQICAARSAVSLLKHIFSQSGSLDRIQNPNVKTK